ncbi:glucose-1-phosphate adenylyltransferase subunit GlgD [Enterococcus sp. LJL120]
MNNRICGIISNIDNKEKVSELTERRDLSTLTFDCKYRIIDFPLSNAMNADCNTVYFTLSQRSFQSVSDHLGSGREWGFDGIRKRYFTYVTDPQDLYKDNIYYENLIDYLKKSKSVVTFVMGTDIIANVDLNPVVTFHHQEGAVITAIYKNVLEDKLSQYCNLLELDEFGVITGVTCESAEPQDTYTSLSLNDFVVDTKWLIKRLELAIEGQENLTLQELIYSSLLGGEKTVGYEFNGYISNIFDIQSYFQSNMDMLSYPKMHNLLFGENKVYTKLKNEAPTYYCQDSNVKKSHFGAGCVIRGTVQNSIISRLVKVDLGSIVRNSIIMGGTKIGENVQIQYAIIDKNVVIDDDVKITGTLNEPVVISKGSHITKNVEGRVITA